MSVERFQTLGRIAGADLARALVDVLSRGGVDKADVAAAGDTAIRNRLLSLRDDGATDEQVAAFAEAADRRYAEALSEIMLQAELGMLAGDGPSGSTH